MFLITTADERTWKRDEKILFLGEWCKLFARREKWSGLDYKVLPYHWEDPERLQKDYFYLNDLYEKMLPELSANLNMIHGANHSVRYWRIIIGLWLFGFIYVLYDRYQSILTAIRCAKVKNTLIIRSDRARHVPHDFGIFSRWAAESDEYNHYLYGRIIEDIGTIPFEYLDAKTHDVPCVGKTADTGNGLASIKSVVKKFFQYMPQNFNKIVFAETYLSIKDLTRLQLSLNQIPCFDSPGKPVLKSKVDPGLRDKIQLRSSDDRFQKLLARIMAEQIPALYVEGYADMNRFSMKAYPSRPRSIFNAVAFSWNEPFKFWAAQSIERNIKLLGYQHGGLYGSGALLALEDHEIKICDTFYTWGWESDNYENTKPLAAASLNTVRSGICPKKGGRLLLVEMALSRYSFIPEMFCTSTSGFMAYLEEQYRFVKALSSANKRHLLVRLYMHDYRLNQKDRWGSAFPEIECSGADESINRQLNKSSLCISTYNATTFLGTFAANFPTILFWNPKHWKTRLSAEPYFDNLREAGILHDTPEKAADKVNEISEDPISWWRQPVVQEAKDRFSLRFARTSDKWLEEWKRELRKHI